MDGGFSLQYTPLLEYREGKGMILFCQMDVTGRTESDPAAETLASNILNYVGAWQPAPRREVVYAGDSAGRKYLESVGLTAGECDGAALKPDQLLVVGPVCGEALTANKDAVAAFLTAGGKVLALGVTEADVQAVLPFEVTLREAEHINAFFKAAGYNSPFEGIGPADVHNRAPGDFPLVTGGATTLGDGVLAASEDGRVVFCQMTPWQFDDPSNYGLKRTFRRTAFLVNRLLGNQGAAGATPLTARFAQPVGNGETRWSDGLYLDQPEEMDDPYRFFRW